VRLILKILFQIYVWSLLIVNFNLLSQDYLWPTNASQYLTSSFAEYRSGHFHAGIDIKTWNKTGFKVFAVRDGYISRLKVSPFGYGKVLYQKLDNGETAVYAHLSSFNEELDDYVKSQQKRNKAYRLQRYFNSSRFPVKKGDVIGYTGSTGIGHPHLHFEIRDANSNPLNPFLRGYRVKDQVPPVVEAISISPLDVNSKVNSDVVPLILAPRYVRRGVYEISEVPIISGDIGFAIKCFDKANVVKNKYAVYRLNLFVDEELKYAVKFDKFSFSQTHYIEFDRDFRLKKRGYGLFQKLYKEKQSQLSFYQIPGEEIGRLRCADATGFGLNGEGFLAKGEHDFRIEVFDYWNNSARVSGKFIVGERGFLSADFEHEENGRLRIKYLQNQLRKPVTNPQISISDNDGITWKKIEPDVDTLFMFLDSTKTYVFNVDSVDSNHVVKICADNDVNNLFFPLFFAGVGQQDSSKALADVLVEKDFYDDYMRIELLIQDRRPGKPRLFVHQIGSPTREVRLVQHEWNKYIGVYRFTPEKNGVLTLEVTMKNNVGEQIVHRDQFDLQTVTPLSGGGITSQDGKCLVRFEANNVYKNLFLRMSRTEPIANSKYESIGFVYEVFPKDVLIKGRGTIQLEYPEGDSLPEKLGIYGVYGNKVGFMGNNLDADRRILSTRISSLNTFTLIRDVEVPEVQILKPRWKKHISDTTPVLLAKVTDKLSGIADERSIDMYLDGKKVIPEYDPETKTIKFECDEPLTPGRHNMTVTAVDRSKNKSSKTSHFFVSPVQKTDLNSSGKN